jgi:dienelactone hydrolase
VRGAAFVVKAAGMPGPARTVAGWQLTGVTQTGVQPIPWRDGTLRARGYQPYRESGRGFLLVPGIHAAGIDEPRLIAFARDIAAMGHPVLTVELTDLTRYEITTRTTDMIEDAAAWMMRRAEYSGRDGRIGMLGISFGGGLTIVASARPAIRNGVAFVMAFGGHGDLPRTLKYLCTGIQPDGALRPPHDYGLAIILLGVADRVVPQAQVVPLRDAIRSFLEASRLDMVDKPRAALEFARASRLGSALDEPARTYMGYVNARDVAHLGPILLPHVAGLGGDPALSPARSPAPSVPVYLLHGTSDNVVPAIESTLMARDLAARGGAVRVLLTPLITHAEVDRVPTMSAVWRLIDFWAKLLNE